MWILLAIRRNFLFCNSETVFSRYSGAKFPNMCMPYIRWQKIKLKKNNSFFWLVHWKWPSDHFLRVILRPFCIKSTFNNTADELFVQDAGSKWGCLGHIYPWIPVFDWASMLIIIVLQLQALLLVDDKQNIPLTLYWCCSCLFLNTLLRYCFSLFHSVPEIGGFVR